MRIYCLQHVSFEGPAAIGDWAAQKGYPIATTALFEDADLPDHSDYDWLVVMGGPMGIFDTLEYPWLVREREFLRKAIAAGKTILGICLGAQLIADSLGARVYPNVHKEIGWFPIELTDRGQSSGLLTFMPHRLEVFHWHGDTFELPESAVHLARSEGCEHQAFLHEGTVLGLQFHLESTPSSVADLVANCADEIVPSKYVQDAERMLAATESDYVRVNQTLFGVLDRLFATGDLWR